MILRNLTLALATACVLAAPVRAPGQAAAGDSSGSRESLFETSDLYWAAGFAGATVILAPLDRSLARALQDSSLQASGLLEFSAKGVRLLASPGGLALGSGVYAAGLVSGDRDLAELGLHTTEAVLIADGITGVIKMVAGRTRPSANPETPYNFHFMGGLLGDPYRSFPSGHTTSAFAAASAATEEVGHLWPEHKAVVGVVLYGVAGLAGISRVYNNAHWASDVVVGAAIGSFTGWKVVRYNHDHPGNDVDRIFLGRRRDAGDQVAGRLPSRSREGIPIIFTIHTR
ncbi:MAG TPA: phosphatase PAP2 family protein [Longimicrobium sp.]|nr:phosphatase PAP2 family protein [Longimicrobium sp.]